MLGYSHFRSPPWRGDKTAVQESMNKDTLQHCSDFLDSSVGKEYACNAGEPASIPGWGRSSGEGIGYRRQYSWVSLVAQLVKDPPAMWGNLGSIPGWERSPGEGKGYPP